MLSKLVVLSCASGLMAPVALGANLQCNKPQTKCVAESTNLTIGDHIGVFNEDGELVATGEVESMKGERRAVLIGERHGAIKRDYHLALLNTSGKDAESATTYKVYQEPAAMSVGVGLGYSTISVGDGLPATELTGYAQWRSWRGMQLVARGVYLGTGGSITYQDPTSGTTEGSVTARGIGLLGGIAYTVRENKPLSFRGEIAAGAMKVAATIDGDSRLVESGDSAKLKNGIAPYGRWSLGLMSNLGTWHFGLDLAQSLVYQAVADTLSFGVSKDLK